MHELPKYGALILKAFSVHYAYILRWLRTVFLQY